MVSKKCEICKKVLKKKQTRFCSKQCLGRNVGILPKPKNQAKFFCQCCGELYMRKYSDRFTTKFCSRSCKTKKMYEKEIKKGEK